MNNTWDARLSSTKVLSLYPSAWPPCRVQPVAYREVANEGLCAISLRPILFVFSTTDMNFVQFKDLINARVSGISFTAVLSLGIKDNWSPPEHQGLSCSVGHLCCSLSPPRCLLWPAARAMASGISGNLKGQHPFEWTSARPHLLDQHQWVVGDRTNHCTY